MNTKTKLTIIFEDPTHNTIAITFEIAGDWLTADDLMENFRSAAMAMGYTQESVAEAMVDVGTEWMPAYLKHTDEMESE